MIHLRFVDPQISEEAHKDVYLITNLSLFNYEHATLRYLRELILSDKAVYHRRGIGKAGV